MFRKQIKKEENFVDGLWSLVIVDSGQDNVWKEFKKFRQAWRKSLKNAANKKDKPDQSSDYNKKYQKLRNEAFSVSIGLRL